MESTQDLVQASWLEISHRRSKQKSHPPGHCYADYPGQLDQEGTMVWRCGTGGWASMRAKCQGQACQPEGRGPIWRQGDRQNDHKSLPGKDETWSGDRASRPYFFNPTLRANPCAASRSTHKGKGGTAPPAPRGCGDPLSEVTPPPSPGLKHIRIRN